jgi:tRNA uridine 5-carbamoylmethylation protein Kti12
MPKHHYLKHTEGAAYIQLHVNTSLQQSLANNNQRLPTNQVPEPVITATFEKFQNPNDSSQHLWDRQSTIIFNTISNTTNTSYSPCTTYTIGTSFQRNESDYSATNIAELAKLIWTMWRSPAAPLIDPKLAAAQKAGAQEATRSNLIHQADNSTRHILATTLARIANKNVSASMTAAVATELSMYRRKMVVGDALQGKNDGEIEQVVADFKALCEEFVGKHGVAV